MRRLVIILMLLMTAAGVSAQQTGRVGVNVSLDRDTIGLNEQATLQVEVSGPDQNLPRPDLPTLPSFEVYSQGRSSNIQIINGQVSASVNYRYLLFPKKAGTFPIDQISVVYNNQRYKGNRVDLTVLNRGQTADDRLESQAQDSDGNNRDYFFEAEIDKQRPYVGEQVTLTLKFLIAVQYYGSPELAEPSTTGFWTELLGNKAPYFQKINNRTYKVIERKYALFPTQTGELTIGRATINATIATRQRQSRDPFDAFGNFFGRGVDVSASTRPVTIDVKPLPTAGKPKDFTGSVGQYSITATANKSEVELSQPVSVMIRLQGMGNIKSLGDPIIPENENFRVYRASTNESLNKANDIIGGSKVFEQVFIPKRPGEQTIPAITYNYFDPASQEYKTIQTRPISLRVIKPEGYVESGDVPYAAPDLTIGASAREIRYIKSELGDTQSRGDILLLSPRYLIVNGLPLAILAGLVVVRKRREQFAADRGLARSRAAMRVAKKRLARARSLATPAQAQAFYAEVSSAMYSFVADKLNISPHGLTSDRVGELLKAQGAHPDLVDRIRALVQKADFARFAPSAVGDADINQSLAEAEDIMAQLEEVRFE